VLRCCNEMPVTLSRCSFVELNFLEALSLQVSVYALGWRFSPDDFNADLNDLRAFDLKV